MRLVVARRNWPRGSGLGNEILSWAKGYIASQVLDARLFGPSWGINKRKYYRNFGTSRFDVVLEELLVRLPHYEFTEQDYLDSGEVDFAKATEAWAKRKGLDRKSSFIVTVSGMWGGWSAIAQAKFFLWAKLLNSRDALANIFSLRSRLSPQKLFVAVHMRAGDFRKLENSEDLRGKFNFRIPGRWYLDVCESLQQALGDKVQFHIFADSSTPETEDAIERFNPGQKPGRGLTECSDLLLMALADVRVCAVSSYSLIANFLGEGPYIWYEPQLTLREGFYSLWGYVEQQQEPASQTMQAVEFLKAMDRERVLSDAIRGWPVGIDGQVPSALIKALERRLIAKRAAGDLTECGVVPAWAMGSGQFDSKQGSTALADAMRSGDKG